MNYEKAVKNIRLELKDYIINNKLQSLVLGVSGGIDSALVAALASPVCNELNIPLIGRSISIVSNKQNEKDRANAIGKAFCTDFTEIDLSDLFQEIKELDFLDTRPITNRDVEKEFKIRMGNIKARLRMIYLYNLASKNHGLVLSTDNWTEYLLGFWTLHGDVGDYGMIQEMWKTEVYDMAEWIVANEFKKEQRLALLDCIECNATDGLGITNSDLDQIMPGWEGSSRDGYAIVDHRLSKLTLFDEGDLDDAVYKRHMNSAYKRNNPNNIKRETIFKS